MNELNELLGRLAEEALYENWRFTNFQTKITHPILKKLSGKHLFPAFPPGQDLYQREEEKMLLNTGLIDASFNELYLVCDVVPDSARGPTVPARVPEPGDLQVQQPGFSAIIPATRPWRWRRFTTIPATFSSTGRSRRNQVGINIADEHIFQDNMNRINLGASGSGAAVQF